MFIWIEKSYFVLKFQNLKRFSVKILAIQKMQKFFYYKYINLSQILTYI